MIACYRAVVLCNTAPVLPTPLVMRLSTSMMASGSMVPITRSIISSQQQQIDTYEESPRHAVDAANYRDDSLLGVMQGK
jgi:hypothetical protein